MYTLSRFLCIYYGRNRVEMLFKQSLKVLKWFIFEKTLKRLLNTFINYSKSGMYSKFDHNDYGLRPISPTVGSEFHMFKIILWARRNLAM